MEDCGAVVLAAGKGVRMRSPLPKVLHELLGEPMLGLVLAALVPLFGRRVWSVIGHGADMVRACLADAPGYFVLQKEQLGTGHALQTVWPELEKAELRHVLVVNGDTPLLEPEMVRDFMEQSLLQEADLAFLTLTLKDPGSFGRVVRVNGRVKAIIEAKDYDPAEHGPESGEINAGLYFMRLRAVEPLLGHLGDNNKSREYYITDLVHLAAAAGLRVLGLNRGEGQGLLGVNDPWELAEAEERLRARLVLAKQREGALIRNPGAVRLGPWAEIAPGAEITGPCEIYGRSRVEAGAGVESHCWIKNSVVAEGARVRSFCHLEGARVGPRCVVGPFARLRPGAVLEEEAHAGNFVEMKKARLGRGAKANHLTYLGDAEVGAGANIGAGTITCNYDGAAKHKTSIGEGAFIGSNTALVAPVSVGDRALVGAGSVITGDVPEDALAVARGRQKNMPKRCKK
ncbi:MAG: bifunctional UDP-N-acetylglucosamine diphosphorylase/glucosamine-1-phosphate N-acetyltransferase GlmU [Deltaproteobacteria bacterium]|nr:bifunctional UDP-N-acetylglucosamine diphosphorylase/glucosamine-1-phosphate N-acetyltransferase GlmU [Deltaproteobacteria bacterium]